MTPSSLGYQVVDNVLITPKIQVAINDIRSVIVENHTSKPWKWGVALLVSGASVFTGLVMEVLLTFSALGYAMTADYKILITTDKHSLNAGRFTSSNPFSPTKTIEEVNAAANFIRSLINH